MRGSPQLLRLGMGSAWAVVALGVAYGILVVASGALSGRPKDPYWAVAEAVTAVGAPIQVVLFAVIYQLSPVRTKVYGLLAFGFMLAMAALTSTVHLTELFVARRIDLAADPTLGRIFDFARPSLVFGADVTAWHFLFGLALLFAALAFVGHGIATYVRSGFLFGGILCLAGLIGPAVGNPYLRSIGVLGYGVVFPIVCLLIGFVFRSKQHSQGIA
jgi:hypothetical protein